MADQKITELTELTSVDVADLLAIVDDPSGGAATKKITVSNLNALNVQLAGTQTITGAKTFQSLLKIASSAPIFQIEDIDQAVDQKIWRLESFGGNWRAMTRNDDGTPGEVWLDVFRDTSGSGVARIEFANADLRPYSSTIKALTSTPTKATDTTLADESDLSGFVLENDARYTLEGFLHVNQNVGNFKFDFDFSDFPQTNARLFWDATDESGVVVADVLNIQTGEDILITTMTDSNNIGIKFRGSFQANASTGGTMDFRWAQETSSANNTTLFENSWIKITKIS